MTLTTLRHQEVYTFLKARPHPRGQGLEFYQDESKLVFDLLGHIHCPVLYIFGGRSEVSSPQSIKRKMDRTKNSKMLIIEEAGHLVPQEEVDKSGTARKCEANYSGRSGSIYRQECQSVEEGI